MRRSVPGPGNGGAAHLKQPERIEPIVSSEQSIVGGSEGIMKAPKNVAIHTVISIIGGVDDEGNPTSPINYLQRLRQLVYAEHRKIELECLVGRIALILRNDMLKPE